MTDELQSLSSPMTTYGSCSSCHVLSSAGVVDWLAYNQSTRVWEFGLGPGIYIAYIANLKLCHILSHTSTQLALCVHGQRVTQDNAGYGATQCSILIIIIKRKYGRQDFLRFRVKS